MTRCSRCLPSSFLGGLVLDGLVLGGLVLDFAGAAFLALLDFEVSVVDRRVVVLRFAMAEIVV